MHTIKKKIKTNQILLGMRLKNKKTVKLFWREINPTVKTSTLWDELETIVIDKPKLEHLFESRSKDLIPKVGLTSFFQQPHRNLLFYCYKFEFPIEF